MLIIMHHKTSDKIQRHVTHALWKISCTVGAGVGPMVASVGLALAGLTLGATDVGAYTIMRMLGCFADI
jgi:hypothetical protein